MTRARIFLTCLSALVVVLAVVAAFYVRRASSQRAALDDMRRALHLHCHDLSGKLRDGERTLREKLPILRNPNLSPAQHSRAEQVAYSSRLGVNALANFDTRGVVSLDALTEGYFCIGASRLAERERDALMNQWGLLSPQIVEARDDEALLDTLARMSAILDGLDYGAR